jgi:hypothetical protein
LALPTAVTNWVAGGASSNPAGIVVVVSTGTVVVGSGIVVGATVVGSRVVGGTGVGVVTGAIVVATSVIGASVGEAGTVANVANDDGAADAPSPP